MDGQIAHPFFNTAFNALANKLTIGGKLLQFYTDDIYSGLTISYHTNNFIYSSTTYNRIVIEFRFVQSGYKIRLFLCDINGTWNNLWNV